MRGFSLVEMLVALSILTVGLLGIATLFVDGMAGQRSALCRAQAANLAADLAERIRANRNAGGRGGAYVLGDENAPLTQDCLAAGIGCTPIALAQDDLSRWLVAIHDTLPGDGVRTPAGSVAVDTSTLPTRYTITVTWAEPGMSGPQTYTLQVQA